MPITDDHRNNFNLLRLLAAVAVLFSHGGFLYRLQMPVPFVGHSLGAFAVCVFFFISGYLIAQSWERSSDGVDFAAKRLGRIYPGLVVATLFSIVVVGAAMTTWSQADYWSSTVTWTNLLNNSAGLATVQVLPGVFEHNPFARAVNGSLWTIRYELGMYLLLALVACLGARRLLGTYVLTALILAAIWGLGMSRQWPGAPESAPEWFKQLWSWKDMTSLGVYFFIGSAFAAARLKSHWVLAVVGVAALVLARWSSSILWVQPLLWIGVSCATFYLAFFGVAWMKGRPHADISYGTYIYAFPIQQAVTEISLARGWSLAVCLALSLVITLVLATVSWFWVEKPAIAWTRAWLGRRKAQAIAQAAA